MKKYILVCSLFCLLAVGCTNQDQDNRISQIHDEINRLEEENLILKEKIKGLEEKIETNENVKNQVDTELMLYYIFKLKDKRLH